MKIEPSVIVILQNCKVAVSRLELPAQLERKQYEKVSKLLKSMGGKWSSSQKAFIFKADVETTIADVIESGEYISEKVQFQYFPTPDSLAKEIVALAGIRPGENCLEPSAGRGAIARHMPQPDCVELNPANAAYLEDHGFNVVGDDFLTFTPEKVYDVIVMNPPFCGGQDAKHIVKAIRMARRKVVAIASASAVSRTDKPYAELRRLVNEYGGSFTILPEGVFKEAGTMVKTCLIEVEKLK
ncbi:MAG: hypothetical protein UH625_09250 [Muribaculaceae bacterium]|nr:hypothetical protein [Muribaculaceae bacterium]